VFAEIFLKILLKLKQPKVGSNSFSFVIYTTVFDMIIKYFFIVKSTKNSFVLIPGGAETGGSRQPCHRLSAGLRRPQKANDSRLCPGLSAVAGKNYLLLAANVVDLSHLLRIRIGSVSLTNRSVSSATFKVATKTYFLRITF
jgi:hypothetical protein